MAVSGVNPLITLFDYNNYKKGIITNRLRFIVNYIISGAPKKVAETLQNRDFILVGDVAESNGKKISVKLDFPSIKGPSRQHLKTINREIVVTKAPSTFKD